MDKKLRGYIAKLVTKKLRAWLVSRVAFFSWGPVGFLTSFLLEKLFDKALEITFLGAMVAYIVIDTNRDLNAVEKILKEINEREGELTNDDMEEIDKRLADAGRELIKFGTIS